MRQIRILFLLALWMISGSVLSVQTTNILILHSYSQEYPWTKNQHQGFVQALSAKSPGPIQFSTEYLDTKRRTLSDSYSRFFAEYLQNKYAGYTPDIIYLTDDAAFQFAEHYLAGVFPDAPLFFSGVNDYDVQTRLNGDRRITGVFEDKEVGVNIDLLGLMDPSMKEILILGDASYTYDAIKRTILEELTHHSDITATFIAENRIERVVDILKPRTERYLFLTTLGEMRDNRGQILLLSDSIRQIVQAGDFIVLSLEDSYLVDGVLGGYVTSGVHQGEAAAQLVINYLASEGRKLDRPVLTSPNSYMFNQHELERLQLVLPEDLAESVSIINLPSTFYQRNYQAIVALAIAGGVFLLCMLSIFLYIFFRKNRQINNHLGVLSSQSVELQIARDRLAQAQNIANMGYWEWNILTGDLYWSDEIYSLFSINRESFSASYQAFLGFIHPADRQIVEEGVRLSVEQDIPYDVLHRIVRPSGEIKFVREIGRVERDAGGQAVKMIGAVQDVTALKLAEKSLIEKTAYLDSILSSTNTVGIVAIDNDLNINYYNSTAEQVFEMAPEQVMGVNLGAIHHALGVKTPMLERALEIARKEGEFRFSMEQNLNGKEGLRYIDSRISPIWNRDQELLGYLLLSEDVTEYKRSAAIIERQANFDPLTELPNRRLLLDRLTQVLAQSKRHGHIGALLFFDLDNFKTINDSLGHPVGDELLKQVASRMKAALREEDTVSRLGGDEFVILVSEIDDDTNEAIDVVQSLAEKIRLSISEPYLIQERHLHVTPSIGIALFPMGDESPTDLLRAADTAMYRAKDSGRNAIRFFLPSMQLAADERLKIMNDLQRAEKLHELKVYFQPQIDASGRVIGAEALLRWDHPERGFISPEEFIPLAEESRQIISIGTWVLAYTLEQFKRYQKEIPQLSMNRIAVNVSPVQFRQHDFAFTVEQTLAEVGVDPKFLTLEVTEGMLIDDLDSTIEKMEKLKKIGVRFSIDDFGTGYSSLAYLKRMPLDEIKIDRSFVKDVPEDPSDAKIVETILTMARQLGLEAIAEGVERVEELDFLTQRGCQLFQGYHFARPMAADAFFEFLQDRSPITTISASASL